MEWSTDLKNGYDDLEVYMEYGCVFLSTTGRNHAKMAHCLFKTSVWYARGRIRQRSFAIVFFKQLQLTLRPSVSELIYLHTK